MMEQAFDRSPTLQVYLPDGSLNVELRLPIYVNRFIEKVEMPQANFTKNWHNITFNQPDTFQKLDLIVKNPAPPHVPISVMLQQMEAFFTKALNLKVYMSEYSVDAVG